MSAVQIVERALNAGREAIERVRTARAQLFVGGERGIGNTTSARAIALGARSGDHARSRHRPRRVRRGA
ncbi:MAG: nicotinate-nucleotide--dimethylbenzimidazole phosphoribosyltransferase [Gammaproteobacteria bacterium]